MVLRRLPWKLCKVWAGTSKVISEIGGKFAWVFQKLFIETSIQTSILNRFHVVLQAPSNGIMATALWIL